LPVPERRHSKRNPRKQRASLVTNLEEKQERFPCLVLDSSKEGFCVRANFHLNRRQIVEVVLDEDPVNAVRCRVVWVGKAGSKQEGEVGLETV
jgi:PilZ domain